MKTSFRFQAVTCALLYGSSFAQATTTTFMGPLEQQVSDTYRLGDYLDDCELSPAEKTMRLGIARALDDRAADFDDYARVSGRASRYSMGSDLKIGPLLLTRRSETPAADAGKKPNANGWLSYTSGWADFEKEFQAIRTQRMSARWARLLTVVRATIVDDYRRATRGVWMGVGADGIAEAPKLVKLLNSCLDDKKCDDLQKNDAFKNALRLTSYAAGDYGDFRKAATEAAKTRALKNLLAEVAPFVDYFDPVKQKGVRVSDANTVTISLDAGDFRGFETDLGLVIEKFWKVGTDKLRIEWMTSTRSEPLFRFLFVPTPKSGSQIDYVRRTIVLGQGAVESIPAHEVGRALGFRARYFSIWHPETCKYEDQSKPDDLLSDGRTGTVTAAHWASLKKVYSAKP